MSIFGHGAVGLKKKKVGTLLREWFSSVPFGLSKQYQMYIVTLVPTEVVGSLIVARETCQNRVRLGLRRRASRLDLQLRALNLIPGLRVSSHPVVVYLEQLTQLNEIV
jgi:hypothetical protein